jgi:hypothetical protein
VVRLKSKSEDYRYRTMEFWSYFSRRKEFAILENIEYEVQWFKNLGKMLQLQDASVKDIFRILINMIKDKIGKGPHSHKLRNDDPWNGMFEWKTGFGR